MIEPSFWLVGYLEIGYRGRETYQLQIVAIIVQDVANPVLAGELVSV